MRKQYPETHDEKLGQLRELRDEAVHSALKEARDQEELDRRPESLRNVACDDGNLLPPIKEALRAGGSIGEVCNATRDVFGECRGVALFK